MNQVKLKITFGEILIFMLFVSIFRPYFLPSTVYQMIKVIVVGIAFIFLIAKAKGILINWSILVCISIIVSSFISFYTTSSVTVRQVLDAVVYAGCFYCCYTLIHYYGLKGKRYELVKILFLSLIHI